MKSLSIVRSLIAHLQMMAGRWDALAVTVAIIESFVAWPFGLVIAPAPEPPEVGATRAEAFLSLWASRAHAEALFAVEPVHSTHHWPASLRRTETATTPAESLFPAHRSALHWTAIKGASLYRAPHWPTLEGASLHGAALHWPALKGASSHRAAPETAAAHRVPLTHAAGLMAKFAPASSMA